MYEALQSNVGQHMAGVQIPLTDAEIPIPIIGYNFDNKLILAGAAVTGAVALGGLKLHRDNTREIAEVEYPQGSDAKEIHQPRALRNRAYDLFLVSALSASVLSFVAHSADPYSKEERTTIDSISVIADASTQGLTEDVIGEDSELVARIKAAVDEINGFDGLPDSGITVTHIAAGTTAEAVATVAPGDDRNSVVEGYETYLNNETNLGIGPNAKPDIEGALRAANAANSGAVFIVAGSLENVDGSLLEGENEPNSRKTVIVSIGQPGSTVTDKAGNEIEASINKSYNDLVLGEEDSYMVGSQSELSEIIEDVIDRQYVIQERSDFNGFGKFALYAGIVAGAGYFGRFLNETYGKKIRDRKNK